MPATPLTTLSVRHNSLFMFARFRSPFFHLLLTLLIGSVWVFHGLFSKLLSGIPRHRQIVGRILGEGIADQATFVIGMLEIGLGLWIFSRLWRRSCAALQTCALVSMNFLEITIAPDLLISAVGMVLLNLAFISVIWEWARFPPAEKIS